MIIEITKREKEELAKKIEEDKKVLEKQIEVYKQAEETLLVEKQAMGMEMAKLQVQVKDFDVVKKKVESQGTEIVSQLNEEIENLRYTI